MEKLKNLIAKARNLAMAAGTMAVAGLVAVFGAETAHAAITVDYSGATTAAEGQVNSALSAGLPIFGAIVAVWLGIKFFRRLVQG